MKFEKRMRVRSFFVLAIALLGWANAWAVCDTELAAYVSHQSGNTKFQDYLKKQHEYLLTLSARGVWDDQYFGQVGHKGNPNNYSDAERLAYANDRLKTAESVSERAWHMYALCMINSKSSNGMQKKSLVTASNDSPNRDTVDKHAKGMGSLSQPLSQQAQQAAQQNQARADQQRQGKRKTNDPAAQAHNCIELDKDPGLFGGFKNTCEYKVSYVFCNFRPKKDSWAESHNCEKPQRIGAGAVGAGEPSAAHTKNTEMVYWFACKDPSWPVDSVFVLGKGIEARCR